MSLARRRDITIVAAFGLLVGCAGPAETPTVPPSPAVAQGLASEDLLFTVAVSDYTDSLEAVQIVPAESTGIPLTNPENEGFAKVEGNDTALFVAWIGRPCEDRPMVQIRGDPELQIAVDRGQPREGDCPSYPHAFAVQMEFEDRIDVSAVQLQVATAED